jgi:hypothetical protein
MRKSTLALGMLAALAIGSSLIATQPAAAANGCGPADIGDRAAPVTASGSGWKS